jgi:hypothetical protein
MTPPATRRVRAAAWLGWPTGLVLALAHAAGALPTPAFGVLAAAYLAGVVLLVRHLDGARDRAAAALVLVGPTVFTLAGLTGAPTARLPAVMLANAAVLLAAAATVLGAAVVLALRAGPENRPRAALAVAALVVGSSGYLLNLLARGAVVASGAVDQQVAVEDTAWVASAYLTGLPPGPTHLAFLLVWLDLVQVAYVVLAYVGFAGLVSALDGTGLVAGPVARAVGRGGVGLAGVTAAAAVGAGVLPGTAASVAAEVAFVLTIPFMSTLLPYALGIGLLRRPTEHRSADAVSAAPASRPAAR